MTQDLPQADADWVVGILAVTGAACGGVVLGDAAVDSFLQNYQAAKGHEQSLKHLPSSISSDTFNGSLDLAATLALGKPVRSLGLLQQEGVMQVFVRRAAGLDASAVSALSRMLDEERLVLAVVSDVNDPDAILSNRLSDRLAFQLDCATTFSWQSEMIEAAGSRANKVFVPEQFLQDLCVAAVSLGVQSPRSVLQARHAAQAVAALKDLSVADEDSLSIAARLVFAHRATQLPVDKDDVPQPAEPPQPMPDSTPSEEQQTSDPSNSEVILEAVRAAIPAHLLQSLTTDPGQRGSGRNVKSKGPAKARSSRGRRIGSRRAPSLAGQRLDIIATLRNAAPWQLLRKRASGMDRMLVTRDDFQIHRIKQRNEAAAIFAVDASGSTAFQRLAEAKGAVEAILAECYVRRDKVALVSFRSKSAEELLPPTRSLERARRALNALPGGGGTPLASGLDKTFEIADRVKRAGGSPIVIVLTDGRANVTRAGEGNRVKALEESDAAARVFAAERIQTIVIDVSPEPQRHARALAANMGGTYLAMPRAQAGEIARPVTAALRSHR